MSPRQKVLIRNGSPNGARVWTGFPKVLLLLFALASASWHADAGSVTGTVKNSVTSAAVSGVTVKVNQQSGKQATTNSSGVYTISSVAAGTVTLNASKTGYVTQTTPSLVVPASGTVTAPLIGLVPYGTLTGKVVNAVGGSGVSSATVAASGTSTTATTNSSGTFTLSLPAGSYSLTITKSGWLTTSTAPWAVNAGQSTATGNIATSQGAITGLVAGSGGGAPIPGATVKVTGTTSQTTTDASGAFTVASNSGSVTLTVSAPGWLTATSGSIAVTGGQTANAGTISLTQAGLIRGTVVGGASVGPVQGATVKVTGTSNSTTTDSAGAFNLTVAAGTMTLTLSKSGFITTTTGNYSVTTGETTDTGPLHLPMYGRVTGRVASSVGGVPLAGASVTLYSPSRSTTSSADGSFTLTNIPSGFLGYVIEVAQADYSTETAWPRLIVEGQATDVGTVLLEPSGAFAGTIVGTVVDDATGLPAPGATVQLLDQALVVRMSAATDSNGAFSLSVDPASWLTVRAVGTGFLASQPAYPVTVSALGTTDVGTLRLVPTGTVTGTVTRYASGCSVCINETGWCTLTGGSGNFTLTAPVGAWTLKAWRYPERPTSQGPVTVTAGESVSIGTILVYLDPPNPDYDVVGSIVSAASDTRLGSGTATLSSSAVPPTSISSGGFGFVGVPPGTYAVSVTSPGWVSASSAPFTVLETGTVSTGAIALTQGGKVVGLVRDAATGSPVEDAEVLVPGSGLSTRTDRYGEFLLSVPAGSHAVRVLKENWQTAETSPIPVVVGGVSNAGFVPLTALSTAPGSVSGVVYGGATPASGARVLAVPGGTSTLTNGQGQYTLSLPAGTYSVAAEMGGWASAGVDRLVVTAGGAVSAPALTLTQPIATISGRVLNEYGDAPIVGASVVADGTGGTALTDSAGAFNLAVPPGIVSVTVSLDGWQPRALGADSSNRVLLAPGEAASGVVLTLEPLSTLTGRVTSSVGATPIPGVTVYTMSSSTVTDADGRFAVRDLPGPYRSCTATKNGWPYISLDTAAQVGQDLDLGNIELAATGSLIGRVVIAGRQPTTGLASATVVVDQSGERLTTDSSGFFRVTVPQGTYTVTASKSPYYDTLTSSPVSVFGGETADAGRMALFGYGSVYGTVGDASTGLGLQGVTVTAVESGTSVVTGSGGGFSLRLTEGRYTITFVKAGYVSQTASNVLISIGVDSPFLFGVNLAPEGAFDLAQLAISPKVVTSFATTTGTITATGPAPPGGATILLVSADPVAAIVPPSVAFAPGATSASFPITGGYPAPSTEVKITARYLKGSSWTEAWDLVYIQAPPPMALLGISPATALPGDANVFAYLENPAGTSFSVTLAGPVYRLDDVSTPLCDLGLGQCPTRSATATLEPSGSAVRFALDAGLGGGYYAARVVDQAGRQTSWTWLGIEGRQRSLTPLTPEEHHAALRILPGQTITGSFLPNGDPDGTLGDYNLFFFVAPAGSAVTARLERIDESRPWEDPSSLDPQIELIAPDGFIYANLRKEDDSGTDKNAGLEAAVLPEGGLWILAAETTRGQGDYRLTFDLAPAAADPDARAVPLAGNGNTLPLGVPLTSTAIMLDPRGYPLSGAAVTFHGSTAPEDAGLLSFPSGSTVTSGPDGSASVTASFTTAGKASLTPDYSDSLLSSFTATAPAMRAAAAIPAFAPAGRWPLSVRTFFGDLVGLQSSRRVTRPTRTPNLRGGEPAGSRTRRLDARTAVPLQEPTSQSLRVGALGRISGCQSGTFSNAGVAQAEVHAPFALTLEDLTSKPGESTPPGVRDTEKGIEGHRVDKTIRMRLTVKDATGNVPSHPVLVQMAVGGPKAGKIILDPDGSRIECSSVSFLWHDQDAQGHVTDPNEEFEYHLGEYAELAGFEANAQVPGAVKAVWGDAEVLDIVLSAPDASGAETWDRILDVTYPVRPEPGKPDHFACFDQTGAACPDAFPFWTGYLAFPSGTLGDGSARLVTNPYRISNAYHLADKFGNETYGYTATSATSPGPNLSVGFSDQTHQPPDYEQYTLSVSWNNDPAFPQGQIPSTLSVAYPTDPEWSSGTVTKTITLDMQGSSTHVLARYSDYDQIRPDGTAGVTDGRFPIRTWPGASGEWLQKSTAGDPARLVLLTEVGTLLSGVAPGPEPIPLKSRFWRKVGDHWVVDREITEQALETTGPATFRLSLIRDGSLQPVTDGAFLVQTCPRFDHWESGEPCATAPVASSGGVAEATVNAGAGRGYLGISLTAAPQARGSYYIRVESVGSAYRVRRESDYVTDVDPAGGEFEGAFSIVNVEAPANADNRCGPRECSNCTGSPCFVRTGVYTGAETDLTVPTSGLPLSVGRTYLSSPAPDGALGGGWTSSSEARLTYSGDSSPLHANVLMPDGETATYTYDSVTRTWAPPAGRSDTLVRNADGTFDLYLERGAGAFLHFGIDGLLASVCDENGNVQTHRHDTSGHLTRLSDDTGKSVDLTWTNGKLTSLSDSSGRTVLYEYDGQDRLFRVTDPAGRVRQYEYVPGRYNRSLLARVTDGWGRTLSATTWDTEDRTSTYTESGETYTYSYLDATHSAKSDSGGHQSIYTFDAGSGLITDRSDPGGTSGSTAYDENGHPIQTVDQTGVTSQYTYDGKGRVLSATRDAQGSVPVRYDYAYDPDFPDRVVSVTPKDPATNVRNPDWQAWSYDYYPAGSTRPGSLRTVYRVATDGTATDAVSQYEYDSAGRVTRQTTAGGAVTDYGYDPAGNLETVTGPAGSGARPVTRYDHDPLGRVTRVTDPEGKETSYTYDAPGRVLTVTLPPVEGRTFATTYSYDHFESSSGLLFTEITDPNGRLTRLGYDAEGRLRRSEDAAGGATVYQYTARFLTSITDPNGNVTSYHYDPSGRLDATTFPDGGQASYTYQGDGLLKTKTDRRGTTVTYGYDPLKRLKTKSYSTGGTITYTYQGQKLTTVADTTVSPPETHTFGYDDRYRLTSSVQASRGTVSYAYTPDDRVETLEISSGPTTTYAYNPDGSLHTASWSPVPGPFTWTYTPRGQYDTLTFPNGQTRSYAYDDQGRLTSLTNALGATTLAAFSYGYDLDLSGKPTLLGQRTSQTTTLPSLGLANALTRYGYDPLYQLTRAEYPAAAPFNGQVHTWAYDAIGNRVTQGIDASVQTYSYLKAPGNPLNGQRLESDGVNAYGTDPAGNTTSRQGPGGSFTFGYDPENRLQTISGSESAAYTYDYQGRRTSKTVGGVTTTYLYDGLNLIGETSNSSTSYFLNGPGIDEPLAMNRGGAVSYLDVDGLGSVVATNDASGAVTHSVVFDAWGSVKAEAGTRTHPFTYTGREVGEAGLLSYRARFYQPGVGRFVSEDLVPSKNGYFYARVSPLNFSDPSGLAVYVFNSFPEGHYNAKLEQSLALLLCRAGVGYVRAGEFRPGDIPRIVGPGDHVILVGHSVGLADGSEDFLIGDMDTLNQENYFFLGGHGVNLRVKSLSLIGCRTKGITRFPSLYSLPGAVVPGDEDTVRLITFAARLALELQRDPEMPIADAITSALVTTNRSPYIDPSVPAMGAEPR